MAVFAVYMEKEVDYFGSPRIFGNLYHFKTDPAQVFDDQSAMQDVHDAEQTITSLDVTFRRAQTYGPTDGAAFDNVMREDLTFGDQGLGPAGDGLYAEACLLVYWPLTRSVTTNRKRWLRKFVRLGTGTSAPTAAVQRGADSISTVNQDYIRTNYIDVVNFVGGTSGDAYQICTADGDTPTASGDLRPYYYTRQIGQ